MKQTLLPLLAVIAIATCFRPVPASAAFTVDGINYAVLDSATHLVYVTWAGSSPYTGDIVIPATVTHENTTWTVDGIGDFAFMQEKLTSISLPKTVNWVGTASFSYCSNLNSISFPDTLNYIGNACFNGSAALTSVKMPPHLDYLGAAAFYGTGINEINIPGGITRVYGQTFEDCRKLKKITLPEGIKVIEFQAFQHTDLLESVVIPSTVDTIGNLAFSWSGISSVKLGARVVSLGSAVFSAAKNVKYFEVDPANPVYASQDGVLYTKDFTSLISFPPAKEVSRFVVNEATDTLGNFCCYACQFTDVVLPAGLKHIGRSAFAECTQLTSAYVPGNVESLDAYSFWYCPAMKTITLGGKVNTIGESAFLWTDGLTSVISANPVPPVGAVFVDAVYANATLTVPEGAKEVYAQAQGWNKFAKVTEAGVASTTTDRISIYSDGSTVVVEGVTDAIPVEIYDMTGRCLSRTCGETRVDIPAPQIVVVRAGGKTAKLAVK